MKRFYKIVETLHATFLRVLALVVLFCLPLSAAITVAGSSDFIVTNNYLSQISNCDTGYLIVYCEFKTASSSNDGLIGSGNTISYADFEVSINSSGANKISCVIGQKTVNGRSFTVSGWPGTLYNGSWHGLFLAVDDDSVYCEFDNIPASVNNAATGVISGLTMHDDALIGYANTGGSFVGSIDDVFFGWAPHGTDLHSLAAALSIGIWPQFEGISDVMYFNFIDNESGLIGNGTSIFNWSNTSSTSSGDGVTATTDGEFR